MTDALLFLRHGWKNIWRQKTIWLFSALPFLDQYRFIPVSLIKPLLVQVLFLYAYSFLSTILHFSSTIGVPYLAYCFSIGKPVTIHETFFAIRKFFWRAVGCSCLTLLIFSPFIFMILASIDFSVRPIQLQYSNTEVLILQFLSLFSAIWTFSLCGFFARDLGVWQSLKDAWFFFTSHFGVLAMLGIIIDLLNKIYSAAAGALTLLIQSGFDVMSLSKLNYFNPSISLSKNVLFVIINGVGQIIWTVFSSSIFVLAYLRYSEKTTKTR